jgi:hypothetical protein
MCETKELIKHLCKYNTPRPVVDELLGRGWLVRFVEPPPYGGGRGGYALCPKCLSVIFWWYIPPEYGRELSISQYPNGIVKTYFERDLTRTVMMLKLINNQEVWVPVNIPI